jgi:hypothetical protein
MPQHGTRKSSFGEHLRAGLACLAVAQFPGTALLASLWARASRRARGFFIALSLTLLATGVASTMSEADAVTGRSMIAAGLIGLAALFEVRSSNPTPAYIALGTYGAILGLVAFIPWMAHDVPSFSDPWPYVSTPENLEKVQWIIIGGTAAFATGLSLIPLVARPILQVWQRVWDDVTPIATESENRVLRIFYILGGSVFLGLIATKGYGYLVGGPATGGESLMRNLTCFYYGALYAANARMFIRGNPKLAVIIVNFLALGYELLSGSKGRFAFFVLFPLSLTYIFVKGRLSRVAFWLTIGVFSISITIVYPLLVEYRIIVERSTRPERPDAAYLVEATENWTDGYDDKIRNVIFKVGTAEQVTALSSIVFFDVRDDPLKMWRRLLFFWVPRAVWPEKPHPISGNELGRMSRRLSTENRSTGVIQTGPGELYVYFGAWGFLMMCIAGLVHRLVDSAVSCFQRRTALRIGLSVYAFSQMVPSIITGSFEASLTLTLITLLATWLVLRTAVLGIKLAPGSPSSVIARR